MSATYTEMGQVTIQPFATAQVNHNIQTRAKITLLPGETIQDNMEYFVVVETPCGDITTAIVSGDRYDITSLVGFPIVVSYKIRCNHSIIQ